jgi:hypothetical protein
MTSISNLNHYITYAYTQQRYNCGNNISISIISTFFLCIQRDVHFEKKKCLNMIFFKIFNEIGTIKRVTTNFYNI